MVINLNTAKTLGLTVPQSENQGESENFRKSGIWSFGTGLSTA
jgi:hypothetical protein